MQAHLSGRPSPGEVSLQAIPASVRILSIRETLEASLRGGLSRAEASRKKCDMDGLLFLFLSVLPGMTTSRHLS